MRCRVAHFLQCEADGVAPRDSYLKTEEWINGHPHFVKLKEIDAKLPEIPHKAVQIFNNRPSLRTQMRFDPDYALDGSLRCAVEAIFHAVQFVAYWAKTGENICPWQLDLILGYDRKIPKNQNDDDEDDDNDEKAQIQDIIGDIHQRLASASDNLAFCEVSNTQSLRPLYREALEGLMRKNNAAREKYNGSPQNHRLIAFVDERKDNDDNKDNDDEKKDNDEKKLMIFEAPSGCHEIPKNVCSEWPYAASDLCLILGIANSERITVRSDGPMLTMSIHVWEQDRIACYLHIFGQCLRFMPDDLINILPRFFVESDENIAFMKGEDLGAIDIRRGVMSLNEMVDEMKKHLIDKQYEAFVSDECE